MRGGSSVSTWRFVLYGAWALLGLQNVAATSSTTSSSYPGCSGYVPFINDSVCDVLNNNAECGYDGGDCCSCTCVDSLTKSCGYDADFNCTDPNVPDDCGETPSPAAAFGFPNCTGYIWDLGDELCDDDLNNEECGYDGGDCCRCTCRSTYYDYCGYNGYDCLDPDAPTDCESASPTPSPAAALGYPDCTENMSGFQTGYCTSSLNNEECGYDGGDCCRCTCQDGIDYTCGVNGYDCLDPDAPTDCDTASPTPSPTAAFGFPNCTGYIWDLGNELCDDDLNNEECGYDGGDCCRCTCRSTYYDYCGYNGYDCVDPDAPTDCESTSPTPSPAAAFGYPDCTGDMNNYQTGYCTSSLNNKECGYDGGDCCRCTCQDGLDNTCGVNGYDCLDPDAPTDCDTASPTPSPAAALGYPDCTGDMNNFQTGYCTSSLNNEECGYDGGDCCRCTCEDSLHDCGSNGYNCLDPNADTDCPTPSPTPTPAAGLGYPDCTGDMSDLQNGYCDFDLNNEECGYDEGDCCRCTCEEGLTYTCGYYGFDCEDPDAPTDCPTPSPTLTPAAGLGYPDCTGDMSDLQNGYCDWDLNNEECGYDGGDCCSCTCEDGIYTCGNYGFNCLDPDVDCPSPSPTLTPAAGLGYPDCTGDMSDLQNGYCDWDLNKEDCGYDGGDCCECSCTESSSGYDCGEGGYSCLDPDPCPSTSAKMSSRDIIMIAAIIFIASLCAICAGCFVVVCMRVKMHAKAAGRDQTTHTTSVSPPQQSIPHTTINNRVGQQPPFPHPVFSANPSRQVDVVNPQGAAAQSRQRFKAVMPRGQGTPPSNHGGSSAKVSSSRCGPIPEGRALERSSSMVMVGHRPNADTMEVERIRLAVAESVRVQTISEAILEQEIHRPLPVAYPAITGTEGGNPSNIVNNVNAEEKTHIDAEKKNNGQDEDSGSEWGSDEEGGMEEKMQQDSNDELGTEDDQQPDTGGGNGDADRHNETRRPIGTAKESLSGITNDAYIEDNISRNSDEGDQDQDSGSVSKCISDGEGGTEEDGYQDAKKPCAGADQATGTKVGGNADEQERIVVQIGPACEEETDNTPHGGTLAAPSVIEN